MPNYLSDERIQTQIQNISSEEALDNIQKT